MKLHILPTNAQRKSSSRLDLVSCSTVKWSFMCKKRVLGRSAEHPLTELICEPENPLEEILLGLDLADQTAEFIPTILAEGRAYNFDNLTRCDSSDCAALAQRKATAHARHKSCCVEVARTCRVDAFCCRHNADVNDLATLLDKGSAHANLDDNELANLRDRLQCVDGLLLARECLRLVLVRE